MVSAEEYENLLARVTSVETDIARILAIAESCETLIRTVVDDVKPTIDAIMSSPLGKMLGGKKK